MVPSELLVDIPFIGGTAELLSDDGRGKMDLLSCAHAHVVRATLQRAL